MSWQALRVVEPALPQHCEPANDFLVYLSSTLHTCVPSNLALVSSLLGVLSILSWLFAQLPQIYKNYAIQSTSGLSIYFLVEWCLGDLSNLLGALFTHQASWQVIVAGYYCFVDFMLVLQWVWYERLKHGKPLRWVWAGKSKSADDTDGRGDMEQVLVEGVPISSRSSSETVSRNDDKQSKNQTPPQDIQDRRRFRTAPVWRMPNFGSVQSGDEKPTPSPSSSNRQIHRLQPSSSITSPSPRTVLFLACLVTLARASPIHANVGAPEATLPSPSPLENAGTILSWLSTFLYLFSRLPQLYKNYSRRSTAGLSPHLFAAAFFGNLFYSSSILTNPCAWDDFAPYGGGGWVGGAGSLRSEWIGQAAPFWLGAAGVLGLDGAVGLQFLLYGEGDEGKVVVVEQGQDGRRRRRWRRVSGWMRGWVPGLGEMRSASMEREGLIEGTRGQGYGTAES